MFFKSPALLHNVLFNLPQTAVMVIALSLYQGITSPLAMLITYVQAYCAGFLLTALVKVGAAGAAAARGLGCLGKPVLGYLVTNLAAGALMGVLMNLFLTWMAIGPVPAYPAAYLHTLLPSVLVSAVSACIWTKPVMAIVTSVYPEAKLS